MASNFLDVCRFNPTAGSTTDWTYLSAVTGYQSPAAAGAVNGAIYSYRAESNDLSQWEVGYGAYNSSTGVFARTTVLFNSAGTTAKINFTTVPQVAIVALAEDLLSFNAAMSLTDAQKAQAKANLGVSGFNYLLNPSGEVNQVAVGSQADVTYDFDQWLTLTETAAVTVSAVAAAENNTPYMMRSLQAQASAQRFGRIQWTEYARCAPLRGQSVVLSARVRMSASTTLRYAIVEWTGTADAITKDIVNNWSNGTFTAGNFFTSTSTTIVATGSIALTANTLTDIAALTGAVSGSMNNLAVFFWTDSQQAQNVTLDVAKAKLEVGTVNTPYIARPVQIELRDVQRFWVSTAAFVTYLLVKNLVSAAQNGTVVIGLPVPMRTAPTFTTIDNVGSSGKITMFATNGVAPTIGTNLNQYVWVSGTDTTTTNLAIGFSFTANARL